MNITEFIRKIYEFTNTEYAPMVINHDDEKKAYANFLSDLQFEYRELVGEDIDFKNVVILNHYKDLNITFQINNISFQLMLDWYVGGYGYCLALSKGKYEIHDTIPLFKISIPDTIKHTLEQSE